MSLRVLGGRGIAALIRDAAETTDTNDITEVIEEVRDERNQRNEHLTSPELRARIRERLSPIFDHDSDTINLNRKLEALNKPVRHDLTLSSFAHLRGGSLHSHDTKRMKSFRYRSVK